VNDNLPGDYRGEDNFGVGECCELCGDPLTSHNCSTCGELLDCEECGDPDDQLCLECKDQADEIGKALDNDKGEE
jgi:hypothetical protein